MAPLTFPIVVAFGAMTQLMTDPERRDRAQNVVHGDQRFEYTPSVRAGDVITGRSRSMLRAAAAWT